MSRVRRIQAVIYVPGLGDGRISGQRLAVNLWRYQGVEPYIAQMNWADGEAFAPKLQRILDLIDRLHEEGKTVSLVGASAGGSAVMHAYAERPDRVQGVVLLCGKIRNRNNVSHQTYSHNIAFQQSMDYIKQDLARLSSAERQRVLSLRAFMDESVPAPDTQLEGIKSGHILAIGHAFGIAVGLTLASPRVLSFLKRRSRQSR